MKETTSRPNRKKITAVAKFNENSWNIYDYYSETNSTGATQRFFSQSQDMFRTKELEFVHQQLNLPLTVIGLLMKKVQSFCSELVL